MAGHRKHPGLRRRAKKSAAHSRKRRTRRDWREKAPAPGHKKAAAKGWRSTARAGWKPKKRSSAKRKSKRKSHGGRDWPGHSAAHGAASHLGWKRHAPKGWKPRRPKFKGFFEAGGRAVKKKRSLSAKKAARTRARRGR